MQHKQRVLEAMSLEWIRTQGIPSVQGLIEQADAVIDRHSKIKEELERELDSILALRGAKDHARACYHSLSRRMRTDNYINTAAEEKKKTAACTARPD